MLKILGAQKRRPLNTDELAPLIRMNQHLSLRLAPPDGHEQGLQDNIRGLLALHRPADHAPRIEIDDRAMGTPPIRETVARCEVGEALLRPDLGDVGHPSLVQGPDIERPTEASPFLSNR